MSKVTIKTGTAQEFFERGRQIARAADRGERLPSGRVLSFEDLVELVRLVTAARLAVFRAVKEAPGSITDIAERLQRDRSAVKRDVDALEGAGLVSLVEKVLPGHGRMKEVRALAESFTLQAELV